MKQTPSAEENGGVGSSGKSSKNTFFPLVPEMATAGVLFLGGSKIFKDLIRRNIVWNVKLLNIYSKLYNNKAMHCSGPGKILNSHQQVDL